MPALRIFTILSVALSLIHCGGSNSNSSSSSLTSSSVSSQVSSSSVAAAQPRCDDALAQSNKDAVRNALTGLFIQKDTSAIDRYWADPYKQHNPIADSGVATFRSFMSSFVTSPSFNYEIIRVIGECDLVVVQGNYSQTGQIYDMFRVENGKLIEHWDSDSNQASPSTGPTEVEDLNQTHENREIINSLYEELLSSQSPALDDFFAGNAMIRRNNQMGADGFANRLNQGNIQYDAVHHIIADGNFVFVLAEAQYNNRAYALYDLFRLENGKIAEFWDSRRVVPSSTQSGLGIF